MPLVYALPIFAKSPEIRQQTKAGSGFNNIRDAEIGAFRQIHRKLMKQPAWFSLLIAALIHFTSTANAQRNAAYEELPINYSETATSNRAERVAARWQAGNLNAADNYGKPALKAFLKAFAIPEESQVLVFSKTSLQYARIDPQNPRAIYFSDDAYFGWVPGGIYELTLNDPQLGLVFYEIDPDEKRISRGRDCLNCHAGSRTRDWPGVLVRSIFPEADGNPMGQAGGFVIGHDSPFENRWGGWYVTGQHGQSHHLGNGIAEWKNGDAVMDYPANSNLTDLGKKFDTSMHVRPDSDIVALMVLEHQCEMHNRLSRALLRVRKWKHRQEEFQKMIGEPMPDEPTGTLRTVLHGERDRIVEYLLFRDEIELPDGGIKGAGDFEKGFRKNRKPDSQNRSLKDFDLQTRLFKYRCSYMIYSEAFELLQPMLKRAIYRKLFEVLQADEPPAKFAHLTKSERQTIHDILLATKPEIREMLDQGKGE